MNCNMNNNKMTMILRPNMNQENGNSHFLKNLINQIMKIPKMIINQGNRCHQELRALKNSPI